MHKKTLSRSSQSSVSLRSIGLSVLALSALLTGCSSPESDAAVGCRSTDNMWDFPTCNQAGPYNWLGAAGVPCNTPDGLYTRTNCADPSTQTLISATNPGVTTTPNPALPGSTPVTPGVTPPVTPGVTPPVTPGVTPPVTPGVTPPVTPGVTPPVTPGVTPPVTPGTTPVTPGTTPVTPGTEPVTPGTPPVTPPAGGTPAGYWTQNDWHGCVWTGIDDQAAGTSIAPEDFTGGTPEGGYCVKGNVAATPGWLGVALLGFNLSQDSATADCTYVPVDVNAEGPPAVELTKKGLAVNVVKRGSDNTFTLRAQIQGPNGASDANDRWCANITVPQGKELIEWGTFNTECWEGGDGNDYNGEPISAIVFTVPGNGWPEDENGTADDIPYDFCINGLTAADTAEEAPDGAVEAGDITGVIGGDATGADYERVKVSADGETYVIQNNNWGDPDDSNQSISFVNNSFTVTDGPEGSACSGCPLSFPSIYIGASGNTDSGKYSTRGTDNLPASISSITSAQSSVQWSGNPGGGANASYDIWFAKPSRGDLTGKRYNDGLDGFIMLWLYDPSSAQPIGSDQGDATINGMQWDVWVGNRGTGPSSEGADLAADPQAPVISYVAKSTSNTFNGDLKAFFTDAQSRSGAFTADLLLTDVFFGFEIWSGGQGLKVDNFSVNIAK